MRHKDFDLDKVTVDECAILLRKAFNQSEFTSLKQVAEKAGINYHTMLHYFEGHRKPSKEKWDLLWRVISPTHESISNNMDGKKEPKLVNSISKLTHTNEATKRAQLLKYAMMLALENLEFFRNADPQDRQELRKIIAGEDVGYFTSLFSSLYDEEHLRAWKAFSR